MKTWSPHQRLSSKQSVSHRLKEIWIPCRHCLLSLGWCPRFHCDPSLCCHAWKITSIITWYYFSYKQHRVQQVTVSWIFNISKWSIDTTILEWNTNSYMTPYEQVLGNSGKEKLTWSFLAPGRILWLLISCRSFAVWLQSLCGKELEPWPSASLHTEHKLQYSASQ